MTGMKWPRKEEINRVINIGEDKLKVEYQIEKKYCTLPSLISSLFGANQEALGCSKDIMPRAKNRSIINVATAEITSKHSL